MVLSLKLKLIEGYRRKANPGLHARLIVEALLAVVSSIDNIDLFMVI